MIKYLLLFINLLNWLNVKAFDDFDGQMMAFDFHSNVPFKYSIDTSNHSQLILIKNHEIDSVAFININKEKIFSASWMGRNGYYFIFVPSILTPLDLTIKSLDSENQHSKISIRTIELKDTTTELIQAFKDHANASNIRYQNYIGMPDKREQAIQLFESSFNTYNKFDLGFFSGLSSFEIHTIHEELSHYKNAFDAIKTSDSYWNEPNNLIQKAIVTNSKGLMLWQLKKLDHSIEVYHDALSIFKQLKLTQYISQVNNNIGLSYWSKGQVINAQNYYNNSLEYYQISIDSLIDAFDQDNSLPNIKNINSDFVALINNLAHTYDALGSSKTAEKLWKIYFSKSKVLSSKDVHSQAKNNLGLQLLRNGQYDFAIEYFLQARNEFKQNKNTKWLSLVHYNLATSYSKLGLYALARIELEKSIHMRQEVHNQKDLIETYLALIYTYMAQKNNIMSQLLVHSTLKIAENINYTKALAELYTYSSQNKFYQNNINESANDINKALSIVAGERYPRFNSQMNLQNAKILLFQNNLNKSIELLNIEVNKLNKIWDVKLLNTANNLLAQAYFKKKLFDKAHETITRELDNLKFYIDSSNNNKIQLGLSQMLKESLNIYALINTKLEQSELGFIETNIMLQRFNSKDNIANKTQLHANENDDLFAQIEAKSIALERQTLSKFDRKKIQTDMIELKAKIDFSFDAQVPLNQTTITFKDIQNSIDNSTLIIQYSIGESGGISWWISKDKVETHEMLNKKDLFELINLARQEFISGELQNEYIHLLSSNILHPLKSFDKIKSIQLILDEPLNLVPFNALFDPRYDNKLVIDNSKIKRLTSIQSLNSINSRIVYDQKNYNALVIADPVTTFSDMRLPKIKNHEPDNFKRLPATLKEAKNIQKLINAETVLGFNANKEKLLSLNLKDKNLIHFATHAFFHPQISGLSSLVLSTYNKKGESISTAYLRALDISKIKLNSDLIVLSGCETGINMNDNSLGLGGLTDSFMRAGSKNLIASLWNVNDRDTEKMMHEFYKAFSRKQTIEDALYNAQKQIRNNRHTSHPKYWAGWFLLTQ